MENVPLYNSRIISTFIEYLKNSRPEIDIEMLLNDAGITSYEVEDEGHWLTQRQVDNFHDALMRQSNDFSLFREAGRYMVSSRSVAPVRQFLLGFVTPTHAYTMVEKVASYLNRGAKFKINKIGPNKVEIITTTVSEVNDKPYQCENRKGCFEAIAKLFTKKLPRVEHPVCMHQGGSHCQYIISWEEPSFLKWKRIRNYLAFFAILLFTGAAFALPSFPLTIPALLTAALLISTAHYSDYIEKKDIYGIIETQGNAANRLLDQITISYNNALLVQEIGQAVSNLLDMDQLFKFIMDTLQKRLDFERGMIMLANRERTELVYVTGFGYNPEHKDLLKKTTFHLDNPRSRGHFVAAFKEQKPFLIDDIKNYRNDLSTRSYQFAEALGARTFICVPIVYEGQSEGILAVDNPHSNRPLNQSDVSLLMGIAPQIAISINNARSLRQIRESEARFRALSENSPDIIYTLDNSGLLTYVNPAAGKILGYSRKDVLSRPFSDFTKETDKENFFNLFNRIKNGGETIANFKGLLLAEDGTEKLFDMSGAPNLNALGEIIGVVGTLKDITEQNYLEKQLYHASKMNALGTLTGGISHDFNNIVQAIGSYNQLLMMKKTDSDPDWKYLMNIQGLTKRATDLINQLLLFSRKVESKLAPMDINTEIRKFYDLLIGTLPKKIILKMDLADDLNVINGDAAQLGQVIMNLTLNARDAMPEGGEIIIQTKNVEAETPYYRNNARIKTGNYVLLRISDTGCGMDKETMDHIFEPFFTTKSEGKGTGIGLAVVYGIVKNHNGYIFCDSEPCQGTTFEFYLPTLDLKIIEGKREPDVKTDLMKGHETILLVDDELPLLETGKELLSYLGYNVLTAESGEKALTLIDDHKHNISIVILDLMMPGMGGENCLVELHKRTPGIKVIIASGYTANLKIQEIIDKGASTFIQKPYRFEDLSKKIRELMDVKTINHKAAARLYTV